MFPRILRPPACFFFGVIVFLSPSNYFPPPWHTVGDVANTQWVSHRRQKTPFERSERVFSTQMGNPLRICPNLPPTHTSPVCRLRYSYQQQNSQEVIVFHRRTIIYNFYFIKIFQRCILGDWTRQLTNHIRGGSAYPSARSLRILLPQQRDAWPGVFLITNILTTECCQILKLNDSKYNTTNN